MLFRGLMVGAASGKLGSVVASHNKGGQYLRARVTPTGAVPTPYQSAVRNALSSLAAAWSSDLDPDQRSGWETYALNVTGTNRLGDSIQLSGINWYIACNTPRLQAGLDRVDDAPTTYDRGSISMVPTIPLLNDTEGHVEYGVTLTAPANVLIYEGRPFSSGRSKYFGSMRLAKVQDITAGVTGNTFVPAFLIGSSNNQDAFDLVISYDDGRLSTPFRVTFPPVGT